MSLVAKELEPPLRDLKEDTRTDEESEPKKDARNEAADVTGSDIIAPIIFFYYLYFNGAMVKGNYCLERKMTFPLINYHQE